MLDRAREVLDAGAAAPGHIFNLGHGVIPSTDPDQLARLTALRAGALRALTRAALRPAREAAATRRRRTTSQSGYAEHEPPAPRTGAPHRAR